MNSILLGIAVIVVIVFAVSLIYRRQSLPCPVWLRWCVEIDNPLAKNNSAAFIVNHLDLHPGMTVLDAGCGPGRVTIPLAKQTGEQGKVVAMDLQSGMLDRTRQKAQTLGLGNIHFLHAGLGEGKLDPNQFDRAILVTVLGEIPHPEQAAHELFAALKSGGILSITEIVLDPHYQSRTRVLQVMEAAGFREKAFWGNWFAYTLHVEKP